jgi:glycosyltransferase involved in cell wall biosynthesis
MGFRPDVERWIAAADLCVLPSMREGLPRVVVQYLAAGKPVVVTHLEGIEEIVEDGVNGFVVGHDDFDGMGRDRAAARRSGSALRRWRRRRAPAICRAGLLSGWNPRWTPS